VQIERDPTGEGSRVNIRGLGSNFAVLTMNGAQLQTASDNSVGFVNDGRGSSLDLFPTELFNSLTVSKSPVASQLEGGISGSVELRPIRPFDTPGFQLNWQAKGLYDEVAKETSPRAGVFVSNTWDETSIGRFGVLVGAAYADKEYRSDTFNTVGFTTFNLQARCPSGQPGCNSLAFAGNATNPSYGYGGGASLPATVPTGTGFGLTDAAPLTVCGPGGTSGLSCNDLSNIVMPRLGRAEVVAGSRERISGLVTAQWQPSDALLFNLDLIYAESQNDFFQHDLMLAVRSTNNNVPINVQANDRNVLTHATFANAQLLSENRPYSTEADFVDVTLGMDYQLTERLKIRSSVTFDDSSQDQSANTVLLRSPLGKGYALDLDLDPGALTPRLTPNFDPNDPALGWQWDTLRVQPNRRSVKQKDAQLHVEWGDANDFRIAGGVQYTDFDREIVSWDVSSCATNAANGTCGGTSTVASQFPGALAAIPNAQLGNYMKKWNFGGLYGSSDFDVGLASGWAIPDFKKMGEVINFNYFENDLDPATRLNTLNPRSVDETTKALYVQVDGSLELLSKPVRYNAGVRALETDQEVAGIVDDPTLGRGVQFFDNSYREYLPSANVAVDLTDSIVFRLSGGRTMTRPNPGDLAPANTLSVSGDTLTRGNPQLEPYFAKQLDVGLEWYISPRNTVSMNLWQKKIEGFTSIFRTRERFDSLNIVFANLIPATQQGLIILGNGDPNAALVNVDQRQNTPQVITLRGLELTLNQPLDFVLEGLGFTANFTRITQTSDGAAQGLRGTRQSSGSVVTGLSPNTYNFIAYFERESFSSRVSYNYRDPFTTFLGPQNNFEGDGVSAKSQYLDASVSWRLPWIRSVSVSLEAQNLLNEIQYQTLDGQSDLPFQAYAPGRTFVLGVSGRL
jgi:TonB-dependent receptor